MTYKTKQEIFWAAEKWGNDYINRNTYKKLKNNINFWSKIISRTNKIKSIIEFGANIGLNLLALKNILPDVEFSALEINKNACKELEKLNFCHIYNQSILDFKDNNKFDLVIVKNVLIHINPNHLDDVNSKLYDTSLNYILIGEDYSPNPVELIYRGEKDKLFKRDFAGEILDKFNDLELVDYGFQYHRDNNFPLSDVTWFLLKKHNETI